MIGIYKITNPNGRVYIGQTTDIDERLRTYKRKHCKKQRGIFNSILKHGWDEHIFEIIEECEVAQLNSREGYWQDFYNSVHKGLNCIRVKDENINGYMSEKTKQAISIAKSNGTSCDIKVRHKITGKVYRSIIQAAKELGIGRGKIYSQLKGITRNTINLEYVDTLNPPKSFLKKAKIVLDTQTGIFYYSAKEASEYYDVTYSNLRSMLNGNSTNKTSLIYV